MGNIDRKYLVMGGTIIGIIAVLLISMLVLSSCTAGSNYEGIEKKLIKAAEDYVNEKSKVEPGNQLVITSDQLVSGGYIKSLDKLKDDNCSATVLAMNNGGVMNYLPNLVCDNYETKTLKTTIIDDSLVTKEDGLYAMDGEYVFRGKKVNNYVKFAGKTWRILKIDKNGNIRLIDTAESDQYVMWDNKYNTETDYTTGENDYKTSFIRDYLNTEYKKYKDTTKKHIVPADVCVGERMKNNLVISYDVDCSEKLEKEYVSLINPTDYAIASLDEDCKQINDGSCVNFNYMYNTITGTWTTNPIANDTYEVILYSPGHFSATEASDSNRYNLVIHISGSELYISGNGTIDEPYVIE